VRTWERGLAGLVGLVLAANGLAMLFASLPWYDAVPGVTATGPFNPHFVKDIGAAYLTVGGGCLWFAARPRQGWPALVAGALFLTLHAAIHVYDAVCGSHPLADLRRDFAGVYVLALLPLLLAMFRQPRETA
jgi:hypothetical protein